MADRPYSEGKGVGGGCAPSHTARAAQKLIV